MRKIPPREVAQVHNTCAGRSGLARYVSTKYDRYVRSAAFLVLIVISEMLYVCTQITLSAVFSVYFSFSNLVLIVF